MGWLQERRERKQRETIKNNLWKNHQFEDEQEENRLVQSLADRKWAFLRATQIQQINGTDYLDDGSRDIVVFDEEEWGVLRRIERER